MRHSLFYGPIRLKYLQECLRQYPSRVFRAFSDAANEPLKQWTFRVSPFIELSCQLHCDVSVQPLDPHAFPGADRVFITVHGRSGDDVTALDTVQVRYDVQSKKLRVVSHETTSNLSIELTTPIKSGVYGLRFICRCAVVQVSLGCVPLMSWSCGFKLSMEHSFIHSSIHLNIFTGSIVEIHFWTGTPVL